MWKSLSKNLKKRYNFNLELLLDEDEQIIATYWSPIPNEVPKNHFKWMNSAISLSGTMIGIRCKNWQLVVASCIPMAIKAIYDCYNGLRLRKHKLIFKKLISLLKEQYDLNHLICKYYQAHINVLVALSDDPRNESILIAIHKEEQEFADVAVNNILQICLEIQRNLNDINTNLGVERNNYNVMCNLNLESFLLSKVERPSSQLSDNLNAFNHYSKFYDTYGLLMSSFLGCVALSMSINIWRDADKFNSLLYNNIPKMSNSLEKYISETKDSFKKLQDYLIGQPIPRRPYFPSNARQSVFIFNSLADCLYNIQLACDITKSLQQKIIDKQEPDATDTNAMLEDILEHNRSSSKCIEIVIKMNETIARGAEMPPIILPHSSDPLESDEEEYVDIDLRNKLMPNDGECHRKENERSVSSEDDLDNAPSTSHQIPRHKRSMYQANTCLAKNNSDLRRNFGRVTLPHLPPHPPMVNFQELMPELSGTSSNHYGYTGIHYYADLLSSIARRMNHPEEDYGYSDSSDEESVEGGSVGEVTEEEEEI